MRRSIARALVAGTIAVTGCLLVAPAAHATDVACRNQAGDVDILGVVGVDQYDEPATGNGILAVCTPDPSNTDSYSGVRVDQDPATGTCVAVILFSQQFGCRFTIPV